MEEAQSKKAAKEQSRIEREQYEEASRGVRERLQKELEEFVYGVHGCEEASREVRARLQKELEELAYGVHNWLRQLPSPAVMESPNGFVQRSAVLSACDLVAHELLFHAKLVGPVSTKRIRTLLRNKPGVKELTGLSTYIHEAVEMLLRANILEQVHQECSESEAEGEDAVSLDNLTQTPEVRRFLNLKWDKPLAKQRGRKCFTIQKRTWAEITACGASTASVVQRLRLSSANFP